MGGGGGLSLALVVGAVVMLSGLMASDVGVHAQQQADCPARPCNTTPEFADNTRTRSVPENTLPGVNIGAPISATDPDEDVLEYGDTLTYSLGGTDAASFDIDASTGQLITKAPLDAESKDSYMVMVTVTDSGGYEGKPIEATREVTITVENVPNAEAPLAPVPPTVVSGPDNTNTDETDESTTSLKVVWHPPDNAGRPNINDRYAVEYKLTERGVGEKSTEPIFFTEDNPNTDTTEVVTIRDMTTARITGLEADTSYDVRVRATNGDGDGLWSLVGTGSTNKENNRAPTFNDDDSLVDRDLDENTPAREDIDSPVTATDGDTTTLTYELEGPHADLFSFDTRSGQIRTKAPLNHEDPRCGYVDRTSPVTECIYRVTVTVIDRAGGSDATRVHIEVDDRNEPPSAPARPTVRATEKSSTSLDVSWTAPENMGPPITGYTVQYRKGNESFSDDGVTVIGITATISGIGDHDSNAATDEAPWLSSNTSYEVRVRAENDERDSDWSASGTGRTNRANHQPIFDDRPHTDTGSERGSDFTVSRRVDENPRSGQVVGRVFADDADNDKLTYSLVASADTDAAPRRGWEVRHRPLDRADTDEGGGDLQL